MTDAVLIIMFAVFGLILAVGFLTEEIKKNKELKNKLNEAEKETAILKDEIKVIKTDYAEANKTKEKMETGDSKRDFNNSISILRDL